MHILIVGARHIGKSTLINKILQRLDRPVYGFQTVKENALATEELGSPIYIYDVTKPKYQTEKNLIGYCKASRPTPILETFNKASNIITAKIPKEGIILMDEIGFMEAKAERFCEAIFQCLDGEQLVIAAVKDKNIPFLEKVRNHPNCKCFYVNVDNRESLVDDVIDFLNGKMIRKLHPEVKVRISNTEPFFGPGPARLIKLIGECGSVKEACAKMHVSYSKGWNMIKRAEAELGYKIVDRRAGGKHGGKASITAEGEELLQKYELFEVEIKKSAKEIYQRIFE